MNKYYTEHDLLSSFLQNSDIMIFWKDPQRRFLGASQSFLDYYGFQSVNEILGKTDEDMGWHINPDPYMNDEYQVIQTGTPTYCREGTCIIKGMVRHIIATKMPVHNKSGKIVGLVGYFKDVTEEYENTQQLQFRANNDPLTKLANRNGLIECANAYIEEYEKHHTNFAIIFIDVNGFKLINDTYGHDFGDKCLQIVANDLLQIAGSTSVVVRFGGDEFVILRQIPEKEAGSGISNTILSMIQHIRLKQEEARLINDHFLKAEVSIGWCAYSETEDFNEALKLADERMYEEKRAR